MGTVSVARATSGLKIKETGLGLLLTLAIAVVSFAAWWYLRGSWLKVSALLLAFVLSLLVANLVPRLSSRPFTPGIELASTRLLRTAIALLGLTVSATVWLRLGPTGVTAVLANLAFAFLLGIFVCRYLLKMPLTLATLIGGGTAICGASAIAALGPAIKAKDEETGAALAAISLFGLAAMFTYPLLFAGVAGDLLNGSEGAYGLWVGMGIHETAQVVAAASQVEGSLGVAVMAKSVRIFMIAPVVFGSLLLVKAMAGSGTQASPVKIAVPLFAVGFLVFSILGTLIESSTMGSEWKALRDGYIGPAVTFTLAWAFAGVGLKIRITSILATGWKVFFGGLFVAVTASVSAFLLSGLVGL